MKPLPSIPSFHVSCTVLACLLGLLGRAAGEGREVITFIAASDTHYTTPDEKNDGKRTVLESMNRLEGGKFPASLDGKTIGKPRGVLVAGDLGNGGRDAAQQMNFWMRDFGLTGAEGKVLKLPVYETWGNHDGGKLVPGLIAERNARRPGVTKETSRGPSYSWDWGPLHLVSVGMYPGNDIQSDKHRSPNYDPRKSLAFLTDDLARVVGDSGRPVVVMQHLNLPNDSNEWWAAAQRDAYSEVLKKYNVVAIVDGHEAGGLWKWNGIDVLGCNDLMGGYWVVQIEGTSMIAGRTLDGAKWKRPVLNKTIKLGNPAANPATPAQPPATPAP